MANLTEKTETTVTGYTLDLTVDEARSLRYLLSRGVSAGTLSELELNHLTDTLRASVPEPEETKLFQKLASFNLPTW